MQNPLDSDTQIQKDELMGLENMSLLKASPVILGKKLVLVLFFCIIETICMCTSGLKLMRQNPKIGSYLQ